MESLLCNVTSTFFNDVNAAIFLPSPSLANSPASSFAFRVFQKKNKKERKFRRHSSLPLRSSSLLIKLSSRVDVVFLLWRTKRNTVATEGRRVGIFARLCSIELTNDRPGSWISFPSYLCHTTFAWGIFFAFFWIFSADLLSIRMFVPFLLAKLFALSCREIFIL